MWSRDPQTPRVDAYDTIFIETSCASIYLPIHNNRQSTTATSVEGSNTDNTALYKSIASSRAGNHEPATAGNRTNTPTDLLPRPHDCSSSSADDTSSMICLLPIDESINIHSLSSN